MATLGVGSAVDRGITAGMAGAVPSDRAGIAAIFRRSWSSLSALLSAVEAGPVAGSLILAAFARP
ncbi:hypothetical protein Pd630_LPD11011 (plasmid) [Rhodococcus opacus PD630]|nr:hypothetical protein Pd630_LPD11011 [Rhodococcus opacus PD630]